MPTLGYIDSPTVSFGAGRFLVAYTGNGQVLGNSAAGAAVDVTSFTSYYGLRVSSPATAASDGGGYRYPSLSFNSATNTTLLAAAGYQGYPVAQEIGADGIPIAGALDFLPDPGPNFDARTQYTIPIANNVTPGFLYLDNHQFLIMRTSRYSSTGGGTPTSGKSDFSSDGKADIVWQRDDGALSVWVMNGTTAMSGPPLSPGSVDAAWRIAATGDFNGDGKADLVWQHAAGWLAIWYMNGTTAAASQFLTPGQIADGNWRIAGSGDFNGDGKPDLVWQHANGSLLVWYMNGATAIGSELLNPGQISDPSWSIVGVGDFNGDARPDLMWQHPSGWLSVWYMNGRNLVGGTYFNPGLTGDANWRIRAVTDINGDGQTDLIWQHMSAGWLAAWLMNGTTVTNTVFLNPSSISGGWKIMGPR